MAVNIATIEGKEYAIVPISVYESMIEKIEEEEDIRDAMLIQKKIDSGQMEMFPSELVDALTEERENAVKLFREYRALTQEDLAKASGVSVGLIRKIESNKSDGSIKTLKSISRVLNISIDLLV